MPPRLSDEDIERIVQAMERSVMRATLRALGYIALVLVGAWVAVMVLAWSFTAIAPPPGGSIDSGGWALLLVVVIALGAGAYALVHVVRAAFK
jgi:hypothetical protein